jgi:hypothetical protein
MVHLGTIDVMSVWTMDGHISTLFSLYLEDDLPSCSSDR